MSHLLTTGIFNQRAAASSYLLDTYSGAIAAFSLRQLKTSETTPTRITNSSGSTEADYTVSDIDAGLTAIGANTGTIAKLYDQANANDVLQTTLASQPIIKNAGTMVTSGAKYAIDNSADFGLKTAGNVTFSGNDELWLFFAVDFNAISADQVLFETHSLWVDLAGSFSIYIINSNKWRIGFQQATPTTYGIAETSAAVSGGRKLVTVRIRRNVSVSGGAISLWLNGSAVSLVTAVNNTLSVAFSNTIATFGSRNGNSTKFAGKLQEAVVFGGDQSANRAGIETAINSYYSIY